MVEREQGNQRSFRSAKATLERSTIWWALGLIVAGVLGGVGGINYIDGHIDNEVGVRVRAAVPEEISKTAAGERIAEALQTATDALAAAERAQDNAKRSQEDATKRALEVSQLAATVRSDAEDLRSKVASITQLANIDEINKRFDAVLNEPGVRDAITQRLLPSGAIVAFAVSSGCPDGWSQYDEVAGRFIVGAGGSKNGWTRAKAI